jgi:leucine-rich repeat protein SHOC2
LKKLYTITALLVCSFLFSQKEFEKYGPMGAQVWVDLKEALKVEKGVYKMDLSYKKLDPKLFEKLGSLKDLQALKLSGNEIKDYPKSFADLSNLVYFATYNNQFRKFPPELKRYYNLTHLELSHTKIDSIPCEIAYLARLKTLKFTDSDTILCLPETFKYMKSLKELQIENCIMDSFPKQIFRLPSLTFLYLSNTNTYHLTIHFERMQSLEVLILESNPIEEISSNIYLAKNLRFISLRNNKLTKLPGTISQLDNLAVLDLRGNPMSFETVDEIRALLPGCEVKFEAPPKEPNKK